MRVTPHHNFRALALMLRGRSGLTQRDLGASLGVSTRAIQKWEAGLSCPSAGNLQHLIALFLQHGAFTGGREEEEARDLWEATFTRSPERTVPFDTPWFDRLRAQTAANGTPMVVAASGVQESRTDWGEAPEAIALYGRERESTALARWLLADRARLVVVLGLSGIGKTALTAQLVQEVAPHFEAVCWRSLRNAPPVEEWLAAAIGVVAPTQATLPAGSGERLGLLLELLRAHRGLLVLDNLETVLRPGEPEMRYRPGYEGYGAVLRQLAESAHLGCLLVTSREEPAGLASLAGKRSRVRTLRLRSLDAAAGRTVLQDSGLDGDAAAWQELVGRYGGNPLALKLVGHTISKLFSGQIDAFLKYTILPFGAMFGDYRYLLDSQFERLSALERTLVYWLAVAREPLRPEEVAVVLGPAVGPGATLEGLEALRRRSLLERAAQGAGLTLQPVVLEYVTERLVGTMAQEIADGQPVLLTSHVLVQATAKDYVRHSQERMLARPVLEQLIVKCGGAEAAAQRLLRLLAAWRGGTAVEQGYGSGNAVNLLRLLRGDLRGLDLSRLVIRQAYLAGVEMQDANLAGADLSETILAEAFRHPASVALSADGTLLAAGTVTGEIRLWRVAGLTPLLSVQGHAGVIPGLALSGDGQLIASSSQDGTAKLWEAGSGRLLSTLDGHTSGVAGVALSGDGRFVATGSFDRTVKLWEAPSGRLLATLYGHTRGVRGVALSGDGRLAASGSEDGTIKLWEAPSGRLLATLQGHTEGVWGVALSRDGDLVVSGSFDGTVRLWEVPSGRLLASLHAQTGGLGAVALSGDAWLAISGGQDGTLKLWDTRPTSGSAGQLQAVLHGHRGGVRGVALSGDGRLAASGSFDGTIKLWEAPGGRLLTSLQGQAGEVTGVALSGHGRRAVSGTQDGTVKVWEVPSGRLLADLVGHTSAIRGVAVSRDGSLVISGSSDATLMVWEGDSGRLLTTLQGHTGGIWGVALTSDGQLAASGSDDGTVKLWEVSSGRLLATLQGHTSAVRGVALSRDGSLVATGSLDGSVKLWEGGSGRILATLQEHAGGVRGVALSWDGRLVASGSEDGTIKLWEAPSGRLLATLQGHTGGIWGVALSEDGDLVASGSFDGTVKLWEAPSGRLLTTLQGHTGGIWGVALSEDGDLVLSGSFDGTVKLWEAPSGTCLRSMRPDRRYERMDITSLTGVTPAQRTALLSLGAIEQLGLTAAALPEASAG